MSFIFRRVRATTAVCLCRSSWYMKWYGRDAKTSVCFPWLWAQWRCICFSFSGVSKTCFLGGEGAFVHKLFFTSSFGNFPTLNAFLIAIWFLFLLNLSCFSLHIPFWVSVLKWRVVCFSLLSSCLIPNCHWWKTNTMCESEEFDRNIVSTSQ